MTKATLSEIAESGGVREERGRDIQLHIKRLVKHGKEIIVEPRETAFTLCSENRRIAYLFPDKPLTSLSCSKLEATRGGMQYSGAGFSNVTMDNVCYSIFMNPLGYQRTALCPRFSMEIKRLE